MRVRVSPQKSLASRRGMRRAFLDFGASRGTAWSLEPGASCVSLAIDSGCRAGQILAGACRTLLLRWALLFLPFLLDVRDFVAVLL